MQDFKINLKKVQSTFFARSSKLNNCTVTPQVVCNHPHSIKIYIGNCYYHKWLYNNSCS